MARNSILRKVEDLPAHPPEAVPRLVRDVPVPTPEPAPGPDSDEADLEELAERLGWAPGA